jgi:hypothetical protein
MLLMFLGNDSQGQINSISKAQLNKQLRALSKNNADAINVIIDRYWREVNSITKRYWKTLDSMNLIIENIKTLSRNKYDSVINKYQNNIDSLENAIIELKLKNSSVILFQKESSQKDIENLNRAYYDKLETQSANYTIETDYLKTKYRENLDLIRSNYHQKIDSLSRALDKTIEFARDTASFIKKETELAESKKYKAKLEDLKKELNGYCNDCTPFVSISVSDNFFRNQSSNIEVEPSLGIRLNISSEKLFGLSKHVDFWMEYISPRVTTITTEKLSWDLDLFAVGLDIGARHYFDSLGLGIGFKLGAGQFWGKGDICNIVGGSVNWKGQMLRLELNAFRQDWNYNVEIFGAVSVYHNFYDNLRFTTTNEIINVGSTPLSISIGMRLSLWRNPHLLN